MRKPAKQQPKVLKNFDEFLKRYLPSELEVDIKKKKPQDPYQRGIFLSQLSFDKYRSILNS